MPEGHSIHRIAEYFRRNFLELPLRVSSPQGRFLEARLVDGLPLERVLARGKQLFLVFNNSLVIQIHLGIYGAWDFSGRLSFESETTRVSSMGAPRRLRMAEGDRLGTGLDSFPPEPVGQVRLRLLGPRVCADLRGPTICKLWPVEELERLLDRLGPDPVNDPGPAALERFKQGVLKSSSPIAQLLMNQAVVAGIGNIYRAELLFRSRLDPYQPGRALSKENLERLWSDWDRLLRLGVKTGRIQTVLEGEGPHSSEVVPPLYWVYNRANQPCYGCPGTISLAILAGRKLFWCPNCQS